MGASSLAAIKPLQTASGVSRVEKETVVEEIQLRCHEDRPRAIPLDR